MKSVLRKQHAFEQFFLLKTSLFFRAVCPVGVFFPAKSTIAPFWLISLGMVQANVGQKRLKRHILRHFVLLDIR
jgi:hypothetical protein